MTKSVLAVDDNKSVLTLYEVCFRDSADYEITTTPSPIEALAIIGGRAKGGNSIDLLITDLSMPGMNGVDLIRNAHKASPKTQFMLCSGIREAEAKRLIELLRDVGIGVKYLPPSYLWSADILVGEVKSLIGA